MTTDKAGAHYPTNSNKSKANPEEDTRTKREKIVTREVREKRKGLGHKVAETFAGDDMRSVGSYLLFDVIIPAAKTMISDAASQGVERMLFGDSRPRRGNSYGGSNRGGQSYTSYSSVARTSPAGRAGSSDGPREISRTGRALHDFREIVIPDRGDAQQVLRELESLIDNYNMASVADFYDFVGVTGDFQDQKFGWMDLASARIVRVRDGFILDLPRPESLD